MKRAKFEFILLFVVEKKVEFCLLGRCKRQRNSKIKLTVKEIRVLIAIGLVSDSYEAMSFFTISCTGW